ncbi:MAG: osmolarity response regulator transcription factor OmpR [Pseudomarimonas sp.]
MESTPRRESLLLVDDDQRLRQLLAEYLRGEGFEITEAADGRQLAAALNRGHFDLIVLDLMLPGEDGLNLCRRLRGEGVQTPIVMLTAKGDEIDRIVGLELGADDYLPKPCNPRELLARVRAVLRRHRALPSAAPQADAGLVVFGDCALDLQARILTRDSRRLRLTSGEFALLAVFVRHPRVPLSRDRLASLVHGRAHEPFERSLDVSVSKLRRMIEPDPHTPRYLQTVWGVGYVFVPDRA